MKTSLTKLSSSFLLLSLSLTVWSKPVAQVIEVSGTVFVVTNDGKTSVLKLNQHLEDKSEVMVEEGGSITLNDYYDATYHLTGGAHLKFFDKSVQLKKGKSWIQSHNARHPLALTTANGHASFWKGEFITTFDHNTSRTQFLVVNGDIEVSNVLQRDMKHTVSAGTFTMIDPEVESGIPRTPTKVGLQSLNSALAEFKQLPSIMKAEPISRGIASVDENPIKKGEIIFMKAGRMPASVGAGGAHKYFKKMTQKRPVASLRPVPIKIYGTNWKEATPYEAPREPASVKNLPVQTQSSNAPILKNDPEFTQSLKTHSLQQPKYSKELQNLINDLKSY